jgi:WD40 repeat protein
MQTGKLVTNLNGQQVTCLAWTADTLISGSHDSSIRTWNTTTWQQIAVFVGHTDWVNSIAISPNGRILASASLDKTVRLWNLEKGEPIGSPLEHGHCFYCVSFSTDGKLLVTGCDDYNTYAWDVTVIVREADLDATRRPGQRLQNPRRLHLGFSTTLLIILTYVICISLYFF